MNQYHIVGIVINLPTTSPTWSLLSSSAHHHTHTRCHHHTTTYIHTLMVAVTPPHTYPQHITTHIPSWSPSHHHTHTLITPSHTYPHAHHHPQLHRAFAGRSIWRRLPQTHHQQRGLHGPHAAAQVDFILTLLLLLLLFWGINIVVSLSVLWHHFYVVSRAMIQG